jgi:HlyD family secretion protein
VTLAKQDDKTPDRTPIPPLAVKLPRRRRVALLAFIAGSVIVGGFMWSGTGGTGAGSARSPGVVVAGSTSVDASGFFEAHRRTFDLTVMAVGELEAKRRVELKCEVDGVTTIVDVVPEGTVVKKGDLLVRLADDDLREKIEQTTLEFEKLKADVVSAEQGLLIGESEAQSTLRNAETKLKLTQLDLAKWQKGSDPQKKRDLALSLEKAKRNLVRSKRDLEASKELLEQKFISEGEFEDDEVKNIEAESTLASVELETRTYENFIRPREEREVVANQEEAAAALDRAKHKNDSELAKLRAVLASALGTRKIREERLEKLNDQLAKTQIRAPQDGLVVYSTTVGPSWRRGTPIAQGRQLRKNEDIILLPDTRRMVAALRVNEALVATVKAGQPVNLTIDAQPGTVITGTVSQISVMAEDGGWLNPELREYIVRVDLPEGFDAVLKPAMRCSGQIVTGKVENAIAVPVQAIGAHGKTKFVYVDAGGNQVKRVPVTMGQASEAYVAIVAGLSETDRVLIRKPRPGEVVGGESETSGEVAEDDGKHGDIPPPKAPETQPTTKPSSDEAVAVHAG